MDGMTIHIIVLRLIDIRKKLKGGEQLTDEEKKTFLIGTGNEIPSNPSKAIIMIDEVFHQLKKVLPIE